MNPFVGILIYLIEELIKRSTKGRLRCILGLSMKVIFPNS
ncbi:hypothetical protein Wcon_01202 [Wolbachia endosymbiont of Cylisticus convexus]|nr:hypothetical protein Wcon_01202 [Wolbachia endosymbiont of Cylisticus convexus]